jgi:hypothetical protein
MDKGVIEMIGRRVAVGLSLLSAMLLCAFAAQNALAVKAVNTTAYTCIGVASGGDFDDAHCDNVNAKKEGKFTHKAVPLNEETKVELTNEKVTNSTKDREPAVFKSKVGLTKTEIECLTVKGEGTFTNQESEKGVHSGTGKASIKFSECTVKQPLKCTVSEPIVASGTGAPVEGLGPGSNEMGGEVKGSGAEETFTEVTYTGAECSLKGKTFKIKGSAIATSGPTTESSQTGKSTGATAVYTPKNEMQKLKLGIEPAEFTSIGTALVTGGSPLSGTTVT